MADAILTLKQIENFFQNLTLQMLGLDPSAAASQSRVRIEWPQNGYPGWKIDEDVTFLAINYDPSDPITKQMDTVYENQDTDYANRTTSYLRVLAVNWIAYGPNSFDDMDTIRSALYQPDFRDLLNANNLAMILDANMPLRSPELFNGQWWDRTSFYARFNELVVRSTSVPYLKSANVQIIPN